MIEAMPRPSLPNLHRERTRHGVLVWYVRIGKGPRTRIRGEYGSPEFKTAYQAAIAGEPAPKPASSISGSLAWLVDRYQDSGAWARLSDATKAQRENIIKRMLKTGGAEPFEKITKKTVIAAMDRRKETPFAARNFLETMRGLFRWALASDLVKTDPTADLKAARPKSDGFEIWTDDDIAKFQTRWPIGTRERVAFDLLLYTGLRRGDAVTLGRQHVKNHVARLTTEKTAEPVFISIEPELGATLTAGPCGDLTFICGANGRALAKESFGNWFGETCRAAGVNKSAHGLRKASATRDANNGWTESELEAKYGWRGGQMASKYTRAMNRERLAVQAATRARRNNS